MKIQYCSDIHLEFYEQFGKVPVFSEILEPAAPYLVLAGNIGQPHLPSFRSFFEWCSRNWEEIFYVTGNFEYYSVEMPPVPMNLIEEEIRRQIDDLKNVTWLCLACPGGQMNKDISGTNYTVVGTTLWNYIEECDEERVKMHSMDYTMIGTPYFTEEFRAIEPYEVSILHLLQRQSLLNEIRGVIQRGRRVIIVTHYAPSMECKRAIDVYFQASGGNVWIFGENTGENHGGFVDLDADELPDYIVNSHGFFGNVMAATAITM